ncbi:hypothetical protein [Gemmatimonas sp.]|uniref:hypothetical protein n=1 Tax=Gemmatimonas sp. TaxID=1962908 RepID=UPI0037C12281
MTSLRLTIVFAAACLACGGVRTTMLTGGRLRPHSPTDSVPAGWQTDGSAISMRFDSTVAARRDGRPTLRIAYDGKAPYAGIIQRIDADSLGGRSIELRTHLMQDSTSASVGIWMMAVSANRERLAYINSYDAVSAAPYRWAAHRLRLTVPPGTARLLVGASVHTGSGVMWVSDLSLSRGRR